MVSGRLFVAMIFVAVVVVAPHFYGLWPLFCVVVVVKPH